MAQSLYCPFVAVHEHSEAIEGTSGRYTCTMFLLRRFHSASSSVSCCSCMAIRCRTNTYVAVDSTSGYNDDAQKSSPSTGITWPPPSCAAHPAQFITCPAAESCNAHDVSSTSERRSRWRAVEHHSVGTTRCAPTKGFPRVVGAQLRQQQQQQQ